jgi:hypothetical protein
MLFLKDFFFTDTSPESPTLDVIITKLGPLKNLAPVANQERRAHRSRR